MKIREITDRQKETIKWDQTLQDAASLFGRIRWVNEIPVVDQQGRLKGVIRREDVLEAVAKGCHPTTPAIDALKRTSNIVSEEDDVNPALIFSGPESCWVYDSNKRLVGKLNVSKVDSLVVEQRLPLMGQQGSIAREIDLADLVAIENQPLFSAILESSYDGIYITDGHGITLYCNSAWEQTTGLPRERMLGRDVREMQFEGMYSKSVTLIVLEQRVPVTIFQEYVTGRQALTTGNPVFSKSGDIVRVVSNVRDISGLLHLRRELEATRALYDRSRSELSEMTRQQMESTHLVARSKSFQRVLEMASKAAHFDTTVFLTGESGVGKDVVARYIHTHSARRENPMIHVNCAAIPPSLVESELFGYVKGSFTGADNRGKPGMFELADGGTIFLDEITDLPLQVQGKLLRAIQDKEVYRVGDRRPTRFDTGIIAASNKDVKVEIKEGRFREDLFFRLNVFPIRIPPLRERLEDIPTLAFHFIRRHNEKHRTQKILAACTIDAFLAYSWPGNVRELENLVEYLFITLPGNEIAVRSVPPDPEPGLALESPVRDGSLKDACSRYEKAVIAAALERHASLRQAAKALNLNPSTLLRKARRHGLF
ncbi:MAG: sigma 54-interacting transcriptional regulator [Bacillota bacterium]